MSLDRNRLVLEALSFPTDAVFANLSHSLRAAFPDRFVGEVDSAPFDLDRFSSDGKCTASEVEGFHSQWSIEWWEEHHRIYHQPYCTWQKVEWQSNQFEVLSLGITESFHRKNRHFVVSPSEEACDAFVTANCLWCSEVRGEILVFQEGCWSQDHDLRQAVSNSTLETLVLKPELKETIVADLERFLDSREAYARYNLPWKRGILFMGPPGNGKTHMIKGLVNRLDKPCLYVRNFTSQYGTEEANIRSVFRRARATTPCLLIFEDLDAMLNNDNRSFFLNELDGFQNNNGLLTIATTNHPERLDPAILDRPSRFDRKFTFGLPDAFDRKRYLRNFGSQLDAAMQLQDAALDVISRMTDGYSFAYLKELYVSSIMEWIGQGEKAKVSDLMHRQAGILAQEMKSGVKDEVISPPADPRRRRVPRGFPMG